MSLRQRTYEVLQPFNEGDSASKVADVFLISLILANVIAIILESVSSIYLAHQLLFDRFETFSVSVFAIEYLARVWSSVERPDLPKGQTNLLSRIFFVVSIMALIDLAAILPFFISYFFPAVDLRFLRIFRMARIFKLTRYYSAVEILFRVLYQGRKSFGAAFFILIVVTVIASCGIYIFEHIKQPIDFGSIPAAMWWAMATLTTVGYGDVTPITPMGKLFGGLITIVGVCMVALPAGILASGFTDAMRRREREYEREVNRILDDGLITEEEELELARLREELDISEEAAKSLTQDAIALLEEIHCPHCGEVVYQPGRPDEGD